MNADRELEENVRLNSLMFAYVRLIGEKILGPAFDFQRFEPWAGFGGRGEWPINSVASTRLDKN